MDPDRPKRPSNTVLNLCRCESLESGGVSTRTLLCFYDATCYLQVQLLTSYEGKGGQTGVFEAGWGRGGGERTLRTKGYTELSLCVCALYSVCFSFSSLLRVAVGRHACVHGFLISSSSSSSCVERKTQNMQENSAKQRDFLCNM